MIFLDNAAVDELFDERLAIEAIRRGYEERRNGLAAQIPRADLLSAAGGEEVVHRLGVMSGVSSGWGVAVIRIKSDVVGWSDREEKYAGQPGTFAGTILAYSTRDGRPLAIVQDGVLQHWRVGAAAALGTDWMARPGPARIGLIGSGGMARVILRCLAVLRPPESIRLYSPNEARRTAAAGELSAHLGVDVAPARSAAEALAGSTIVITATSSLEPTISAELVPPGAHITAVSRREVGAAVKDVASVVAVLGSSSIDAAGVPGGFVTRGGYTAVAAMPPERRAKLPAARATDRPDEHHLVAAGPPDDPARRPADHVSLLIAVGTQGVQFAAATGALLERAAQLGAGVPVDSSMWLQSVRS